MRTNRGSGQEVDVRNSNTRRARPCARRIMFRTSERCCRFYSAEVGSFRPVAIQQLARPLQVCTRAMMSGRRAGWGGRWRAGSLTWTTQLAFEPDPPYRPAMIRRRFLLTSLAGALALPLVAAAQQVTKVYRLAIVYEAGNVDQITEPILLPELQRLGYVEGRNLVLIRRSGGGRRERYPDVAREVVGLKPDVIFAPSGRMAEACRMISGTIPIVTITSDPVALGLAGSLQRPGGNITGFTVHPGVEVIAKTI
jgi:ABC transporter substrate binding protein